MANSKKELRKSIKFRSDYDVDGGDEIQAQRKKGLSEITRCKSLNVEASGRK